MELQKAHFLVIYAPKNLPRHRAFYGINEKYTERRTCVRNAIVSDGIAVTS